MHAVVTDKRLWLDQWSNDLRDQAPYDLRGRLSYDNVYKGMHAELNGFNAACGLWAYNRRFYRTTAGRFGWAPDQARAGDCICVLYGGSVPFVLRPVEHGRFEVVGDAYLHGRMFGEGMPADAGIDDDEEFHLV